MTGLSFEVKEHIQTIDDLLRQDPTALKEAMDEYATSRSGPLAVGGIFSYAFLGLQHKTPELLQLSSSYSDEHPLYSDQVKYMEQLLQDANESTAGFFTYAAQGNFGSGSGSSLMQSDFLPGNYYSVAVCLLQPLSRGCVHIRTANPSDSPVVDPRYLTHPLDLSCSQGT
jgi:choline dehydrogenase-like flavoprotein